MRRQILVGGGVAALLGGALVLGRPAPLQSARVAEARDGTPPQVEVQLRYGWGARPVSVIVDVSSQNGNGSATVSGERESIRIPVIGSAAGPHRLVTTATYRVLGRLHTRVREFEAG